MVAVLIQSTSFEPTSFESTSKGCVFWFNLFLKGCFKGCVFWFNLFLKGWLYILYGSSTI